MRNGLRNAIKLQVSAQEMCHRPFETTAKINKVRHPMNFFRFNAIGGNHLLVYLGKILGLQS